MKRVDVHSTAANVRPIADALKKIGVGGVTVAQVRGRGSSEGPVVTGLRGTAKFVADFNTRHLIYTVVDDSLVEKAISAILDVSDEGKSGKIFVSTIDEAVDIKTKSRGKDAL